MESSPRMTVARAPLGMKRTILRFKGLRGLGFRVFPGSGFRA